ncbi:MAG: neutral/alkaline non-lysosomal ceramidase N-terminal domain-containing protein, partial [Bacteroidales bacterium]|nr:neutral/alkaline non-lysosomal ceramidase N-terminal domain-containing protein [Bacteroidales bacterium]
MKFINRTFIIIPESLVLGILFLLMACSGNNKPGTRSTLLIGIAEVNYTPEAGLDLVGNYRGDDYASRGVHDSLYAKALVASDGKGLKTAIISIDICNLPWESCDYIRNHIASLTDIEAENIMVMATHTHSGPPSGLDAPKAKEYLARAAEAVIQANADLKPTVVSVGRSTETRISHNRRLRCIDGTTHMCWEKLEPGYVVEPWGSIDPEVIVLSLEQEGREKGVMVNFGCHATTLTGSNWLYS